MKKILTLLIFILSAVAFSASAQSIDYNNLAPHPRILLTKGDVSKMRELPAQSANAKMVNDKIMALAEGWVDAEAVKYDKSEGDLSAASREALRRISLRSADSKFILFAPLRMTSPNLQRITSSYFFVSFVSVKLRKSIIFSIYVSVL